MTPQRPRETRDDGEWTCGGHPGGAVSVLFSLWILSILHLMVTVQEASFWEGGEKVYKTKESKIKATVCNSECPAPQAFCTPWVGPATLSSLSHPCSSSQLPPTPDFQKPQAAGSGQMGVGMVAQPRHPTQEESRHRPQWELDNRHTAGVWADKALHCPWGPQR